MNNVHRSIDFVDVDRCQHREQQQVNQEVTITKAKNTNEENERTDNTKKLNVIYFPPLQSNKRKRSYFQSVIYESNGDDDCCAVLRAVGNERELKTKYVNTSLKSIEPI